MVPRYVFENGGPRLERRGSGLFLFVDFDGTLVPIGDDPAACHISPHVKEQLRRIASSPRARVAVLSGRTMVDVRERIGLRHIFYGGNHGLEISGPRIRFTHPGARSSGHLLNAIIGRIEEGIRNIPGALLERKRFGFALHYRMADREGARRIREVFRGATAGHRGEGAFAVLRGKKVLELAPAVSWDKGRAALFLLGRVEGDYEPVYIGDDLTDETAFQALGDKGVTVRIGRSQKTAAGYYLRGQRETSPFLEHLAMLIA